MNLPNSRWPGAVLFRLRHATGAHGFTLLELIVSVAIVVVLALLLLPALRSAREKSQRTVCTSNLRQINLGLRMYADDANDRAPHTPGSSNAPGLNWSGYKEVMKSYVGLIGASSARDKVFACPKDTFYYDVSGGFQRVSKGLHEQGPDYLSYAFNGGNARTNSNAPGIAGVPLTS
jgi:prepilin-type N-terminal cleavage/methylation domain-containing protein